MWVDAERGGLVLSDSEVQGFADGLAEQIAEALEERRRRSEQGEPVPVVPGALVLSEIVSAAIAAELDLRGPAEPVVLLGADEPSALQLVALLRAHRRDRGADTTPLDDAADRFRDWTQR